MTTSRSRTAFRIRSHRKELSRYTLKIIVSTVKIMLLPVQQKKSLILNFRNFLSELFLNDQNSHNSRPTRLMFSSSFDNMVCLMF